MPWCPICRNEYREGIEFCAECQAALVDHLEDEKEKGEEDVVVEEQAITHAYRHSAAKAEDNRISAYTLFVVGIAGFVLDLLVFTDVLPVLHTTGTPRYFVCGVMGSLFILFIVFGVVAMRDSKILLVQAQSEDSLLSELTKWCEENLHAEQIDNGLFEEELTDEQKYFKRTDRMKEIINDKFMNLDQALLEHFVDEYYQGLFEDE